MTPTPTTAPAPAATAKPKPKPIYCSGPMFSPGDKSDQLAVATALEKAGYTTYLPQRDGLEIGKMMDLLKKPIIEATFFTKAVMLVQKAGFTMDVYQLLAGCRAVVFNMNGRVPDEGSVMEAATAFGAGMPIVIYKDTPITAMGNFDNCMLQGLSQTWTYAESYDAIAPLLADQIARVEASGYTYTPPPTLQAYIDKGAEVQALHDDITATLHDGGLKAIGKLFKDLEKLLL